MCYFDAENILSSVSFPDTNIYRLRNHRLPNLYNRYKGYIDTKIDTKIHRA